MAERAATRIAYALLVLAGCGRLEFVPEDDRLITVGGIEADAPRSIIATSEGNVVLVGHFRDTVDFGCGPIASLGGADGFLVELTPELACVRVWRMGGPGDDLAIDVTEARDRNFVVTGEFQQTAAGGLDGPAMTAAFQRDIFLSKLTPAWTTSWARQLQGNSADPTYELVNHVRVDSTGNVHVYGRIWGTVQFGWGGVTQMFSDAGWGDAFVLWVSGDGQYGDANTFGGGGSEHTFGMAIDDADNVYIAGAYRGGGVDFDPGPATNIHNGNFDGYIEQRKPDGSLSWLVVQDDGGWRPYQAIAIKPGGELAAVQNDFVVVADRATVKTESYAVADGTLLWSRATTGPLYLYAHAIATDAAGNVYVAGRFIESVDFDPDDTIDMRTSAGAMDAFIQSFGPDGTYRWTMTFGGTGTDIVEGIVALAPDDLVVIGSFEDAVEFGSTQVHDVRTSSGASDIFVRRITR